MATSHEKTVKNVQYKNWLRSGLGLKYLKEGLQPFVTDIIKDQHGKFVSNLQPCTSCSHQTLLPHHALKVGRNCSLMRAKCLCIGSKHTVRTPCPINVCGQIYDKIVDYHYFGDPNFCNTDITKWVTEPWELAKCYINTGGYSDKTSAEDTDCLGILSIIINNLEFHVRIDAKTVDTCSTVRQYRNDIMHSSDLEVTDVNLKKYIENMDAILDDPTQLRSDNCAQLARQKLKKLLETDIFISTEDEISIIREAQRSLERNFNSQTESLQEIAQNLDTTKEVNLNRFESIEKTQDSLRKAIEDFNNKIGDQQKLMSDIQQVKTDLESIKTEAKTNQQIITDRIVVIEESIKKLEVVLQKMELEKVQKVNDGRHKEQLEYLEKKTALKYRLIGIYENHLSTVPISPVLDDMRSNIGEIFVDIITCDHLFKEQVGEKRRKQENVNGEVKSYEDIFAKDGKRCFNMFMLGDAGMGKTTWCIKLVNNWAKVSKDQNSDTKQEVLRWYDIVLLVFLRNATNEVKIIDMIKEQLFLENTDYYEVFTDVLKKEPERCLVIVDGLDEWVMPKKQVCSSLTQNQNIPSKAGLNGCPIFITTRPSKLYEIRLKETEYDRCIKIIGVKDKDKLVEKIISELNKLHSDKVPKHVSDFKKSHQELSSKLSILSGNLYTFDYNPLVQSTPISECMENPLLLIISVCIWFQYGNIEKTLAGNYSEMFRYLFEYTLYMKKYSLSIHTLCEGSSVPTKSHPLPECLSEMIPTQFRELMAKLAKFAFDSLFNDTKNESKLVFEEKKLKTWFTDNDLQMAMNCGILSQERSINQPLTRMTRMSFLHKSFQEFLAAVHIVGQFQNKIVEPLEVYQKYCCSYTTLAEIENVLLFVCGLDPRVASQMSLNIQNVARRTDPADSYLTLSLPLKCTMQVHEFSNEYPSTEYPIHIETLDLPTIVNDTTVFNVLYSQFIDNLIKYIDLQPMSNFIDYIYLLLMSNSTKIKRININKLNTSGSNYTICNFLNCDMPFSLKICILRDLDLSRFSSVELNSFGNSLEKLSQLESLQLRNIIFPCPITLCLQNCRHLNTLELESVDLIEIKVNTEMMENIKVQNCSIYISVEGELMFDISSNIIINILQLLSLEHNTAKTSSKEQDTETMPRIYIDKCNSFSFFLNSEPKICYGEIKHSKMQRKDMENFSTALRKFPVLKIQDLEIKFVDEDVNTLSDMNLDIRQKMWTDLFEICKVSTLVVNNSGSLEHSINAKCSLTILNASLIETELLLKCAVSFDKIKCVNIYTEIIEHGLVLDLVSCRHLKELKINLLKGQIELMKALECQQNVRSLLTLQDNRIRFSRCNGQVTCSNTNKEETKTVVSLAVNSVDIRELTLSNVSVEEEVLVSLMECDHLSKTELINTCVDFNLKNIMTVATERFDYHAFVKNKGRNFLPPFFQNSLYNRLYNHLCSTISCPCYNGSQGVDEGEDDKADGANSLFHNMMQRRHRIGGGISSPLYNFLGTQGLYRLPLFHNIVHRPTIHVIFDEFRPCTMIEDRTNGFSGRILSPFHEDLQRTHGFSGLSWNSHREDNFRSFRKNMCFNCRAYFERMFAQVTSKAVHILIQHLKMNPLTHPPHLSQIERNVRSDDSPETPYLSYSIFPR